MTDLIGPQFFRQQNGVTLAGIEVSQIRAWRYARRANLQPDWWLGNPCPHRVRSARAFEFLAYRRRNEDPLEECRQDIDLANQNQVIDRAGVGNDDHPARRSIRARSATWWATAQSCSRSSSV